MDCRKMLQEDVGYDRIVRGLIGFDAVVVGRGSLA
jgi:hypothetical protein